MFLSSKLCLLIALLLGWLLMDITFHAVPQAAAWSTAFWNERLGDAPLKLVQRGIVHHPRHSQRGAAAASPSLPVTMGLRGELAACNLTTLLFARVATEIAPAFTFHVRIRQPAEPQRELFKELFQKYCHPRIYPVITPERFAQEMSPDAGEECNSNVSPTHKTGTLTIFDNRVLFLNTPAISQLFQYVLNGVKANHSNGHGEVSVPPSHLLFSFFSLSFVGAPVF